MPVRSGLPGQDSCGIEQISDELTLKLRVGVDGFGRSLSTVIWKNASRSMSAHPNSEFSGVRSRGSCHQELVLQTIVGLGFAPQNVFDLAPFAFIPNHQAEHPDEPVSRGVLRLDPFDGREPRRCRRPSPGPSRVPSEPRQRRVPIAPTTSSPSCN